MNNISRSFARFDYGRFVKDISFNKFHLFEHLSESGLERIDFRCVCLASDGAANAVISIFEEGVSNLGADKASHADDRYE